MGRLFGTDGVRGIANQFLTPKLAFRLGQAAVMVLGKDSETEVTFLLGKDNRVSSDMLECAFSAGVCSVGGNVICTGIIPTPGVAYLTRELGVAAGVIISASHNPMEDNGIKFFGPDGYKLPDELEDEIAAIVEAPEDPPLAIGSQIGQVKRMYEAPLRYAEHVKQALGTDLTGYRIVVDCANGSSSVLAPAFLSGMGAEVIPIFAECDGSNINAGCGSTQPQALIKKVLKRGANLGIAFDGDADRMLAVDEKGRLVTGDELMVIMALAMKRAGKLEGNKLVVTVMSNMGLHLSLMKHGVEVLETKVGDRYVAAKMLESGAILGGEQSGHIINRNVNTTGDGLATAMLLLNIMKDTQKPLSALTQEMEKLPQLMVNVQVKNRDAWEDNGPIQEIIEKCKLQMAGRGRILVRASGTEPMIRIMAEGPDSDELDQVVTDIAHVVKRELF